MAGTRSATAINEQGQIVGRNVEGGAYLYAGDAIIDLGAEHTAEGINDVGVVAGSQSKDNPYRPTPRPLDPAIYDSASGQWTALDVARVYSRGTRRGVYADLYHLTDINDSGFAVGSKSRCGLVGSSSILTSPQFDSVTFLPIPYGGKANAINDQNQIVGMTGTNSAASNYGHAYLYDVGNDSLTDLGTLGGGISSGAYDINNAAQVVGTSWLVTQLTSVYDPTQYHGFIWQNGEMTDLNSLLDADSPWLVTSAVAINDPGVIAAVGQLDGETHGLLLVPSDVSNEAPVAIASVNRTRGRAPLPIEFNGAGSYDSDGSIVDYAWDFGDGASGNGVTVTHTYTAAGVYSATLTVTDDGGLTNSTSLSINVRRPRRAPAATVPVSAPGAPCWWP